MCDVGDESLLMLSELALVDWVALLIALILLGVAGVATYLAHISDGSSGVLSVPPREDGSNYQPSHASSAALNTSTTSTSTALHLVSSNSVSSNSVSSDAAPSHAERLELTVPSTPQPPLFGDAATPTDIAATRIGRAQGPDEVIDLTSDREETVGDRAKRLRSRPVAETRPARSTSLDHPPLTYARATNKLSFGLDSTEGFEPRTPGFFSDPVGRHELRYWNGEKWTEYVKEGSDRFIDPL